MDSASSPQVDSASLGQVLQPNQTVDGSQPPVASNRLPVDSVPPQSAVPTQAVVSQVVEPAPMAPALNTPAQAVGQAVQSGALQGPSVQPMPQPLTGSAQKEQLMPPSTLEAVPVVEIGKDKELEPEVEGWIEHLKQDSDPALAEPIKNDQGDIVMAAPPTQVINDKLVVPMTQIGAQTGLKKSVNDSARWLAVWIQRLVKMFGDKVAYRKID